MWGKEGGREVSLPPSGLRVNEVFVLSLLILATNLAAKALFSWLAGYRSKHSPKITKKEGIK